MKSFLFAVLITFSFINADSSPNNKLIEQPNCECAVDDTPDSWCRGVANLAVYDYLQENPNASHEDVWNLEVTLYAICMHYELQFQTGNN